MRLNRREINLSIIQDRKLFASLFEFQGLTMLNASLLRPDLSKNF